MEITVLKLFLNISNILNLPGMPTKYKFVLIKCYAL